MIGAGAAVGRVVERRDDDVHRLSGDAEIILAVGKALLGHREHLLGEVLARGAEVGIVVDRRLVVRRRADQLGREVEFMVRRLVSMQRLHMAEDPRLGVRLVAEMGRKRHSDRHRVPPLEPELQPKSAGSR